MEYKEFFAGKRVTLMGLGLLGRGIGDAAFIADCGAQLLVTDRKTKEELASSLAQLAGHPAIDYVLGEHRVEDFTQCDMVIKAAGVPLDSPYIAAARAAGVPVYMSTALFALFARQQGATLVGITGTRGKSTTTHLVYHALVRAGKKAHLGGNVRGLSTLALLPEIKAGDIVVLELDSWQLQGFGDLKISPEIALFTNLMSDHLNYYPDMDTYFADKANLFKFQKPGDRLFVRGQALERVLAANPPVEPTVVPALSCDVTLKLVGEHNRENAALAAEALRALGLPESSIRSGLESFESVEGRLQKIADIRGAVVYNDNNSTTPDATIAALLSFDQPVVLIAGGADKAIALEALAETIGRKVKKTLLLSGSGTERLRPLLPDAAVYDSMALAVADACAAAAPGDVVLFSPGFASFSLFKNEYDRNDRFVAAVRALQ